VGIASIPSIVVPGLPSAMVVIPAAVPSAIVTPTVITVIVPASVIAVSPTVVISRFSGLSGQRENHDSSEKYRR